MFTGIVTDIGTITAREQRGDTRFRIRTAYDTATIAIGASIACSGVCLTVVQTGADWFAVDVSAETLSRSNLGNWAEGSRVNLERSLRVGDELGGHIVSGHVDALAEVVEARPEGDSLRLTFRVPASLAGYVAEGFGGAGWRVAHGQCRGCRPLRHQPDPAYPGRDHAGRPEAG